MHIHKERGKKKKKGVFHKQSWPWLLLTFKRLKNTVNYFCCSFAHCSAYQNFIVIFLTFIYTLFPDHISLLAVCTLSITTVSKFFATLNGLGLLPVLQEECEDQHNGTKNQQGWEGKPVFWEGKSHLCQSFRFWEMNVMVK